MANNPDTYDCRVAFKECFSVLSECKRKAMKELPIDFFVYFFKNLVITIKTDQNYRDIVLQTRSNGSYHHQFVDATIDIFENTIKELYLNVSPNVVQVYREFLTNKRYITYYVARIVSFFNI